MNNDLLSVSLFAYIKKIIYFDGKESKITMIKWLFSGYTTIKSLLMEKNLRLPRLNGYSQIKWLALRQGF